MYLATAALIAYAIYIGYKKNDFYALFASFLAISTAVMLKIAIGGAEGFVNAPPRIDVVTEATFLSIVPYWLQIPIAILLILEISKETLGSVFLGLGLGLWLKKKKTRVKKGYGEIKRKIFHIVFGIAIALFVIIFGKEVYLALAIPGLFFLYFLDRIKLPYFGYIVSETKRIKEKPGEGAFNFLLASITPVAFGMPWVIMLLAVADGFSSLIGSIFGTRKIFRNMSLEGTLFGVLGAIAIARAFEVPEVPVVLAYLIGEMQRKVDDNLAIQSFAVLPELFRTIYSKWIEYLQLLPF